MEIHILHDIPYVANIPDVINKISRRKTMKKCIGLFLTGCLVVLMVLSLCGQALAQAKPIKIAVLGPMTHISGKHIMNGAAMARDEINQAGGVKVGSQKHPIELVQVDTNELQSVTDATSAAERAIAVDKVDFLMGSWRSEAVLAMQDVAMDYKKVIITEGADINIAKRVKDNYKRYKYWFRAYQNSTDGSKYYFVTISQFRDLVKKELGINKPKVAIVLDKALYTDPLVNEAPKIIEAMGCEVVGLWRPSMVATDMSAELLDIKNKGAHIIWTVSYGPSGLVLCKQWAEYKIPAVLIGIIGEASYTTFLKSTNGTGNYISTSATIARVKITDKTISFWDKYIKTHDHFPDIFATHFYDNLYRLKESIEKAGSLDSDKVVASLEKSSYAGAAGIYLTLGMDTGSPHDPLTGPRGILGVAAQWQGGNYNVIWPPADGSFEGIKYPGVVAAQLPPWMVTFWKKK
jgi:branched-chain amino acid transport system substrate-binding protein